MRISRHKKTFRPGKSFMDVGKSNAGCLLGGIVRQGRISKATAGKWSFVGAYSRRRDRSMLVDVILGRISILPLSCRSPADGFWLLLHPSSWKMHTSM